MRKKERRKPRKMISNANKHVEGEKVLEMNGAN